MLSVPLLLASPDKFRGTLGGRAAAAAIGAAARDAGWEAEEVAISDGGEGFLDCFSGRGRLRTVPSRGLPLCDRCQGWLVAVRGLRGGFGSAA